MAAQVETGVYNSDRGLPWHRLGVGRTGFMTAEEVLREAGLDWTVEKRPLWTTNDVPVPDHFAICRTTDDKPLGVVGNRYEPAQNAVVLSLMDEVIGTGRALYDTAWSLRGGQTVAITAELTDEIEPAAGEKIKTYLTAMNNHDGRGQIRYVVSPVRVVCMNTLAMAVNGAKYTWVKKHTKNAMSDANVVEAREALQLAAQYQAYVDTVARELLSEAFSSQQMGKLAKKLILTSADPSKQQLESAASLMATYTTSEDLDNIRGTKWGALQAVAEWADHKQRYIGKNASDSRTTSILLGRAADVKTEAYELLTAA